MKTTAADEERRVQMRTLAEEIVGSPIQWKQELSILMDCAFQILHLLDKREEPLRVLEDLAGVNALFSYAAAIDWISDAAADKLIDFGRYARDEALKKWSGTVVTVTRGRAMQHSATKH
ncbi:hypothetical protein [Ralstonia mannitolilytica]|uniref:hypothetical protein n=1 Tax=Ralstonia mannitolilytica TaxID=105219 RepID=UPI000CEEAB81|nr:hypothetical protein [Ralstonia mannitolilytica]